MRQTARDPKRRLAYLSLAMLLLVILIAAGIASARLWGADRSELRSAAEGLQQLEQAGLCPYVRYDSFSTIGRVDCIAADPNTPLADYADSFTLSQYSDQQLQEYCDARASVAATQPGGLANDGSLTIIYGANWEVRWTRDEAPQWTTAQEIAEVLGGQIEQGSSTEGVCRT